MTTLPILTLLNGNTVKILTSGRETEQSLTVIDYVDYTQGNPPPFTRHEFVEVFTVLEGRLAFQYQGEAVFHVDAGNTVTVASGLAHTFWNPDKDSLRILLACSPAGLDSFFTAIHAEMEKFKAGEIEQSQFTSIMDRLRSEHGIEITAAAPLID
ncbi:MAG: cupin domain-containing protein [Gammaproteobacteria bacterium]|nr:cupin domain-containing protein [Gammaproteobacteria bacterium]